MKSLLFVFFCTCHILTVRAQSAIHLDTLGQLVIPYNFSYKGTPVGGLSGLTYDAASGTFYTISDDRSDLAPARFYAFRLELNNQGRLGDNSIRWTGMRKLKTSEGKNYPKGHIDPEGIALGSDGRLYISSEGDPSQNIRPFIQVYNKKGEFAAALPIPGAFWPSREHQQKWGVRFNLALEGLAISPGGKILYAAMENALLQDGPAADSVHASPSRLLVYSLPAKRLLHQYRYDVSPVQYAPAPHGSFAVNGISDILALDDRGHLLSLERNYVEKQGNRICLYLLSIRGATDVSDIPSLIEDKTSINPVHKKLLADLSNYGITIDNFEGLALGPQLPSGGRLLLMVSDNNFSRTQETIFTAFSLSRP